MTFREHVDTHNDTGLGITSGGIVPELLKDVIRLSLRDGFARPLLATMRDIAFVTSPQFLYQCAVLLDISSRYLWVMAWSPIFSHQTSIERILPEKRRMRSSTRVVGARFSNKKGHWKMTGVVRSCWTMLRTRMSR